MSDRRIRILIVEDESIVALDLESLLRRLGYDVCGREASGEGALQVARREQPDLILMDISLSGEMDGISSADAIRREMEIPVIFLTAYADKNTVERAKASEAYGYLLKPFQEREIEIAIDMAIYKHETEKKLRAQQALLDATLESIPDAVFTLDQGDRIAYANEEAQRLLGEDQLLGLPFDEAVPLHEIEEAETVRRLPGRRMALLLGNDERRLFEVRRGSFEDSGGTRASVVVLRDISLQVEYEEQIETARQAAEEASQAKSEFIANMSHELRTPMNSILGMSQLAMDLSNSGEQEEYLGILRRSAEELFSLITNVLDFSRVEAGSLKSKEVVFKLDEMIEETAQRYASQAKHKGLYLACAPDPELPMELLGEREWLASILANLLSNAVKFTKEGGVRIEASGERREQNRIRLRLSVVDTGIGVPEDAVSRVFEPFTQVDPSATRDYGGTGIGLAVVRRLVDHLGGEVEVTTSTENGSRFDVYVPTKIPPRTGQTEPEKNEAEQQADLQSPIPNPPSIILWGPGEPSIEAILPWIRRWGVGIETGATLDSLTLRGEDEPALLLTGEGLADVDGFRRAMESPGVVGALLVGEVPELRDLRRLFHLGTPPRLRHLRKLLQELPKGAAVAGEGAAEPETETLRVLVVDDQGVSRLATKKVLENRGHTVLQAPGGKAALELLARESVDAVLLDLEMPEMDGWTTTEEIRSSGEWGERCAIIAMTGHSRDQERERARMVGMDEFLTKPVNPELLDERVRTTVSRRRRALSLRNQGAPRRGQRSETRETTSLLEGAEEALSRGDFQEAEERLTQFRNEATDDKLKDTAFKAILAARRQDVDGALLRLKGLMTGG